jgi:hypothetical protein
MILSLLLLNFVQKDFARQFARYNLVQLASFIGILITIIDAWV